MVMITLCAKQKETQMYRTDFWTLWEKARVGCLERTAFSFGEYSSVSGNIFEILEWRWESQGEESY